jgi:riboflavin kinase / FMN adenylyltransferase
MCGRKFHGPGREVERKKLQLSLPGVQRPAVLRFQSIGELAGIQGPCHLALGVFDGVHLGHQAVISQALAARERLGGSCGVLTFDPYPIQVLFPEKAPRRLLASLDHKASLLSAMGVDFLLALPFDRERAAQEAEDFVREIAHGGVKTVAVGEDWRFGKGRRGDVAMLSRLAPELGFGLAALPPVMMEGERISSTRIRQAIRDGNLEAAARMLGRPYTVAGRVIEGRRLGRELGFPTANLVEGDEQFPPDGVWAVRAAAGDRAFDGVANLGVRPTVDGVAHALEVHLFDFEGDLYGKVLEVEFVRHLRGEQKFASLDALKDQIARDAAQALYLLRGLEPLEP